MRALFEGGPLDGKEDLDIPDDLETFIAQEYAPERMIEHHEGYEEYVLPLISHGYSLVAKVGNVGRFVYQGQSGG
jgi:hypothetical protein